MVLSFQEDRTFAALKADELAVVFWSNLAVPSVALPAALVAVQAEAVLGCSPECWIYLVD